MARKDFRCVRRRYRASIAAVGAAFLYTSVEVPQGGIINRFRVYNPDGTATPNLTVEVWLQEPTAAVLAAHPASEHDKIIAPAAAAPVAATPAEGYFVTKVAADSNYASSRMGLLWLRGKTANATLDHTLYFELEIETCA